MGLGDRESARMHDSDLVEESAYDDPRPVFSIGGVHWIAWVFILFALGDLAWLIVSAQFAASPAFGDYVVYGLRVVPAVVAVLLPAVLLIRNPDAVTRTPVLLLGTVLFALVQGLLVLAVPLQPIFESVMPASEISGLVPLAAIYNALTLLTAVVGLSLIARGLSLARWYEDRTGGWPGVLVLAATIFATVVGILSLTKLDLPDPLPTGDLVYLASSVLLGILRMAAWSYLAVSALRGLLASEEPGVGWGLAALGGGLIVIALALINIAGVVPIADQTIAEIFGWVIYSLYALGHLALLWAFAIGLPSPDDGDDFDDDEFDNDDEFPGERLR